MRLAGVLAALEAPHTTSKSLFLGDLSFLFEYTVVAPAMSRETSEQRVTSRSGGLRSSILMQKVWREKQTICAGREKAERNQQTTHFETIRVCVCAVEFMCAGYFNSSGWVLAARAPDRGLGPLRGGRLRARPALLPQDGRPRPLLPGGAPSIRWERPVAQGEDGFSLFLELGRM